MEGLERVGMERQSARRWTTVTTSSTDTCYHSSFIPVLLSQFFFFLTKSPLYLSASYVPNELSSAGWNFRNPRTHAHMCTQARPSRCRSSYYVSHPSFSFYTTTQCQFLFPRQPLHQSLMVLPPRVLLMVPRSTESALFWLSCMRYWRWRENHDWKLISNVLSPNRGSRDALRAWNSFFF